METAAWAEQWAVAVQVPEAVEEEEDKPSPIFIADLMYVDLEFVRKFYF